MLAAAAGESLLSPATTAKLLGGFATMANQDSGPGPGSANRPGDLTGRERQTLAGLAHGLSNKAIAAELGIAENTAKNHVRAVLEKLRIGSRTEAELYAVRHELVDPA